MNHWARMSLAAAALISLAWPLQATAAVPPEPQVWTYADLQDATPKYEGGYAGTTSFETSAGPHGGYDTTTNKCRVCHAVHRATGAYSLTRADQLSNACEYCHVASGHSDTVVYDANEQGTATSVGHRVGGPSVIPASTRQYESIESTDVALADASGQVATYTIDVRSVGEPNGLFKLDRRHGHLEASSGRQGYTRIGPVSLTCLSCHVVHGSTADLWRPREFPGNAPGSGAGYKLLRRNPSGSVYGPDDEPYGGGGPETVSYSRDGMLAQQDYTAFAATGLVNATATIEAVEATLAAGVTFGEGKTIWDSREFATSDLSGEDATSPATSKAGVNQYALSAWCADCHNLAIGEHGGRPYDEMAAHESSRTHTSPTVSAGNGPGQCYTCHRADLTPRPVTAAYDAGAAPHCEKCHYGTGSYAVDPVRTSHSSDFPHSAETSSAYMLGAWTVDESGEVTAAAVTAANAREVVCKRCHQSGQQPHTHISSVATETISGTLADAFGVPYTYEQPNEGVTATYDQQSCASCHRMDVREEHAKPSSEGSAAGCLTCHPAPRSLFETWDKTCAQTGCHVIDHDEMYEKHAQEGSPVPSETSCGGEARCHDEWAGWDVAMVHANAWYEWSNGQWQKVTPSEPIPRNGCGLCHDDASVTPGEKDCATCHPSRPAGHPSTETSGSGGGGGG